MPLDTDDPRLRFVRHAGCVCPSPVEVLYSVYGADTYDFVHLDQCPLAEVAA